MLEDAHDLVVLPINSYGFPQAVFVGEQRLVDSRTEHDDGAGMLLIEGADESSTSDGEQGDGIGVLRFGATQDYFFDAATLVDDLVGIAEEETARPEGGDDLDVRRGLANELRVIVIKIFTRTDAFGPARRIAARGKAGDEVGPRTKGFHLVLHELVQTLNDGGH